MTPSGDTTQDRGMADAGRETVGPMVLGAWDVVLGQAYELAVHGLDLVPCGVPPPPRPVLQAGLAALADVTGALAAREGVSGGAELAAPEGGWGFAAHDRGWAGG